MKSYKVLNKQVFSEGKHSLVPIRSQDRYDIMQWRNEQLFHLRQQQQLTRDQQDQYFSQTVNKLFDQEQPDQILFSYLEEDQCIGYGGLVHINWLDRNAEISFLMNTAFQAQYFQFHWSTYLRLLEPIAWQELSLHKIYTYAFDVRPELYPVLETVGFYQDATLREHAFFAGKYIDVIIHAKLAPCST